MSDESPQGQYASWYAQKGWYVFPCHGITLEGRCTCTRPHGSPKEMGKHPANKNGHSGATTDLNVVQGWWQDNPDYNVAFFCQPSGFFVIDIDPRSGGFESFQKFEELVEGALPPTVESVTGVYSMGGETVRGRHLYYKVDQKEVLIGNLSALGLPGIDIKHNGYILAPPSRHMSGVSYQWREGHAPWEIEMAEAPEELLEGLRKKGRATYSGSSRVGRYSEVDWGSGFSDEERVNLDKMLEEGIDEGERAVQIYRMACAVSNTVDVNTEMGRAMVETLMIRFNAEKVRPSLELEGPQGLLGHVHRAIEFVRQNPKSAMNPAVEEWQKQTAAKIDAGAFRTGESSTTHASINESGYRDDIYSAPGTVGGAVATSAMSGASFLEATSLTNMDVPKHADALTEEEGGFPGKRTLSDTGNGRRIVDNFGTVLRYTPGLGYFNWSGNHWQADAEGLNVRELSKKVSATISSEIVNYDDDKEKSEVLNWARNSLSSARIDAAIKSATSDPRIRVDVAEWDSSVDLLGVANGVVDLKTGELLRGRPDLHITRRSPVAYTMGMRNPRWEEFIDFATGGDRELQEYLQRAVGYTLTGLNNHDVMFLVYGPAGSGKNTFVEAIVKCLGTSQLSWPMDSTILAQDDGRSSSTDMYHWAELRGRRMVWVDELPESERIKENAIKKLTGSSEISARSPGEKPFTFESQAKLWLTTNHRPIITDDAMWRRIRPIPWSNVPDRPDPSLKEYLFDPEGGLPAILSWAVEGAIKFMASPDIDAFGYSKAVQDAAEMYRKSEDRIGMFLDEETHKNEDAYIPMKMLFYVYRNWSESRGERGMSQIAFTRKLRDRGLNVEGDGGKSKLVGYSQTAHVPEGNIPSDVDWSSLIIDKGF
jgi:P4 family phage/plasmid primase-like protien